MTAAVTTVLGALCETGPLLDAFDIPTEWPDQSGPGARAQASIRYLTRSAPPSTADTLEPQVDPVQALAPMIVSELESVDCSDLASWLSALHASPTRQEAADRFWKVFAPATAEVRAHEVASVDVIRSHRAVEVVRSPAVPIRPHQVLFTANALIGPDPQQPPKDAQRFVFDHPVPLGAPPVASEIVHGLRGLADAAAFERARGTVSDRLPVLVSVSTTHHSLGAEATADVRRSVRAADASNDLEVFVVDEAATHRLVVEVLAPVVGASPEELFVFGVEGPYGRHYSFLKAVAALWQAVMDPGIQATFKVDFDQVFPQDQLVRETGRSALQLIAHPSWGAAAVESDGSTIELGMIAGALVNAADIGDGLFTPDVVMPTSAPQFSHLLFRKEITQAVSTEAEMMDDGADGRVRQRIHVTGGTTGIRVDSLTRAQPFVPSFVGRAEDQAYLMASLAPGAPPMRTLHVPGLFMRHDAATIAAPSASDASASKTIADLERFILFTAYADHLGLDADALAPFTGSYVIPAPVTIATLSLLLLVMEMDRDGQTELARHLLEQGIDRLTRTAGFAIGEHARLPQAVQRERTSWSTYYDAVGRLAADDGRQADARSILGACAVE